MIIKSFNLEEQIKQYNNIHNKEQLDTATFGFKYFDSHFAETIRQLIDSINNSHELYIFNDEESQYIKTLQQTLRVVIDDYQTAKVKPSYQKGGIYNKLPLTEEQINALNLSIQGKNEFYKWVDVNWKELNKKLLDSNLTLTDDLYEFAINWKRHSVLARCNDNAIYQIASVLVPHLIIYIVNARKELSNNSHQIPAEIAQNYKHYLTTLEQDIDKLQITLVESMLARLQAFDESRGCYSNPVIHFSETINLKINFNPRDKSIQSQNLRISPIQPYDITKEQFSYFHQYIEKHGSHIHRKQLYKISWFRENSSIQTTVLETQDNGLIIVPVNLKFFIPLKKRWPNWLFSDINIRQDIFKESSLLFASLLHAENKPSYFIDIYDCTSFKKPLEEIKRCETLLLDAQSNLTKPPISQVSWFSFGTKRLINKWQLYIEERKLNVIEKKFDLAERLINCLKSQAVSQIDIPWQSYEILFDLSQELENLIKNKTINQALQQKMYTINSTLSKYASVNKLIIIINKLSKVTLPTDAELDYLHRFIDSHVKTDPQFLVSFKQFCEPQLKLIVEQYLKQLKINIFDLKDAKELQNHEKLITTLFGVLNKTSGEIKFHHDNEITLNSNTITSKNYPQLSDENNIDRAKYQKALLKMLLEHLQKLYSLNSLSISSNNVIARQLVEQLNVSKNIMLTIAKEVGYLEESLIKHVERLEKLKIENSFLFKANCKSLIISLSNKLLNEHFDKELNKFDEFIHRILKVHHLSDEVIAVLLKKKAALIKDESLDTINFTPSELNLLDKKLSASNINLTSLLKMSAKAHQVKAQLTSNVNNASSISKPMLVKNLAQTISHTLKDDKGLLHPKPNKVWFAKQYLDEAILAEHGTNKYLIH